MAVCRECGQPIKAKYSFTEKLVKDLISFVELFVQGMFTAVFGITIELWYLLLPKIGYLLLRIGATAIKLGTRLLNKRK